jgi:hypothetical protein
MGCVQAGPETDPNAEDVPVAGDQRAIGPRAQAAGAPRQVAGARQPALANVRGLAAADRQPSGAGAAPRVRVTLERALAEWDKSFPALTHDQLARKREEFWCGALFTSALRIVRAPVWWLFAHATRC